MSLEDLRREIDHIDAAIIELLASREQVSLRVGKEKQALGIKSRDEARYQAMLAQRQELAKQLGANPETIRRIWGVIHEASVNIQDSLV